MQTLKSNGEVVSASYVKEALAGSLVFKTPLQYFNISKLS